MVSQNISSWLWIGTTYHTFVVDPVLFVHQFNSSFLSCTFTRGYILAGGNRHSNRSGLKQQPFLNIVSEHVKIRALVIFKIKVQPHKLQKTQFYN